MNPKILVAFLGGAALASGIVYMAVRPDPKPIAKTLYVQPVQTQPVASQTAPPQPAPPQPEEQVSRATSPVTQAESPEPPVRRHGSEKPAIREAPVRVARAAPPLKQPPPSSAPAPTTAPAPTPTVGVVAPPLPHMPPPSSPEPVTTPEPAPTEPAAKVEPPQPHTVTLAAGTQLSVRVGETLSTKRHKAGDTFMGTLAEPLTIDEFVIAERGARCEGRIVESDHGGRVKGVAQISVELTGIHTSDGQRVRIRTTSYAKDAPSSRRADAGKVGGGAALGAIIGAIAGGGKGAAIGAGVGGAAGAGDVALTRGKPAEIPVETRVIFRVQEPVTITERLQ